MYAVLTRFHSKKIAFLALYSTLLFFSFAAIHEAEILGAEAPDLLFRPYFLPEVERHRIRSLIASEVWATREIERLQGLAEEGDGYAAAFLFVIEGERKHLATARRWLLDYGRKGGDLGQRALEVGNEFFKSGQPWLGDVYYKTDIRPLLAYDWIFNELTAGERKSIETGILASARFRIRSMDRWSHTPNLVFKPTFMVAVAGLVTGNRELIDWGFSRKPGSARGGVLEVLRTMFSDDGPWQEAPIYPVAHKTLLLMTQMARLLSVMEVKSPISWPQLLETKARGLIDYYIDTAYPVERTDYGQGQIRVASYGDGATSAAGDLFLVNPAGRGLDMHEELAEAYAMSRDPRYAAFLTMAPDYKENLIDRPPPLSEAKFPSAPSKVWPNYGLAMLRSNESPSYWTSKDSIAVFHIMSQGYGHDHRDKFAIMLHGAGRLLYPDYNAVQYENPAEGWTRSSVAHNTVIVDETDTRNSEPTQIRSDFSTDVKFLATSASGVFRDVDQTRVLLLTKDYLLDFFHLTSPTPRTYDYLLHSFGRAEPDAPESFVASQNPLERYWKLANLRAAMRRDQWSLDFMIDEATTRAKEDHDVRWIQQDERQRKRYQRTLQFAPEWYSHPANIRITMAADPETRVAFGTGPDLVNALIARREERRDTVFVAVHEPYSQHPPRVSAVTELARSGEALLVRVTAQDYVDYAAIAFGPQSEVRQHVLRAAGENELVVAFKSYAYLRVFSEGSVRARGGLSGFRISGVRGPVVVNDQKENGRQIGDVLSFGEIPNKADPLFAAEPDSPIKLQGEPKVVRLFERDSRTLNLLLENTQTDAISGTLEFEAPNGIAVEPDRLSFEMLKPRAQIRLSVKITSRAPPLGQHTILYRLYHPPSRNHKPERSAALGIPVVIGPVLQPIYQHPKPAVYRVHAPKLTVEFDMIHGMCRYLADDDGTVRLSGYPLFTFSGGGRDLLTNSTTHAFTWPKESPASLTTQVYDVARYSYDFVGDRLLVKVDESWTQPDSIEFDVPGAWFAPEGEPHWTAIVTKGVTLANEDGIVRMQTAVQAAELNFPESARSLCFEFLPPQDVEFSESGMKFSVNSREEEHWTVGFCPAGELASWRWDR